MKSANELVTLFQITSNELTVQKRSIYVALVLCQELFRQKGKMLQIAKIEIHRYEKTLNEVKGSRK